MAYQRRHTRTFTARDPDGNQITIDEYTRFASGQTLGEGLGEHELGKEYWTKDGRRVNHIGEGLYEIVGNPNTPLTCDDLGAS